MGSDAQAEGTAAAPAAAPAAAAGGKGALIAVAVVVIVVIAAVVGYMVFMGDDSDGLTGKWTVSGGDVKISMVMNNDTANTTWMNQTIPSSTEVIDFDDETTMPEGMEYKDLGDGKFEITGMEMMGADFGTITGTYTVDGDTMTLKWSGSGTYIDGADYFEIEMEQTVNFAKA